LGTGLGVTGVGSSGSGVVTTGVGGLEGDSVAQPPSALRPAAPAAISQRRRAGAGGWPADLVGSRSSRNMARDSRETL